MKRIGGTIGVPLALAATVWAEEAKEQAKSSEHTTAEQHHLFTPSDLKWSDGPPGLPAGAKMAVL